MPQKPPVPTSPQDVDPPGRPADPIGIDLNAPEKPGGATEPHLPHERDQNKNMTDGNPDAQVQQAFQDLQDGQQDTGKGPPSDDAYRKLKR
ncbi:hypothetical protein [Pulveribacter suum]|uniref:Uncharacterized protein n=1 Tax=Pulveribacter suum TaxID=2116657 RepID=A0A2P1NHK0_9BURK|nr:hypothetical protein [Pulveribacter suum]AVP56518.1 hypothetical protein C7H73_01720 [Pulveribacter suum]